MYLADTSLATKFLKWGAVSAGAQEASREPEARFVNQLD